MMKKKIKIVLSLIAACFVVQFYFHGAEHKDYPIILWWTKMPLDDVISCDGYQCLVSQRREYINNSHLAIIAFYGSDISLYDLPLPRGNTTWAIYHEESSRNIPWFLFSEAQDLFNITATFSRHSDFPLMFSDVELDKISSLKYYLPLPLKKKKKLAPVVYLQSICDNPIQRDAYVQELMKYIEVDSYGKCLNNKNIPEGLELSTEGYDLYNDDLMQFLAQYKFIIAIENSICDDYITEKLWRALMVGSIPIYLGSKTIKDWLPNNKSAILMEDFRTIKDLANYINTINKNDNLYFEYMAHKLGDKDKITNELLIQTLTRTEEPNIEAFNCHLCKSFQQKKTYEQHKVNPYNCVQHKAWGNVWKAAKCQAYVLDRFVGKLQLKNYTKQEFDTNVNRAMTLKEC